MSSRPVNLCEGPFWGKIIRYSIPIVLGGILQLAFNAADLIIVGQYCGSSSMGAVGSTSSLTTLLVNFFMGLSVGSGVAVAQAIGAGNGARIRDTVHTAMPTAILCGLILTVVGIGFLILRIPYGLLWAALIALVDAVPVLGTGTVLLPWALLSFFSGEASLGCGLLILYGVITLVRQLLEPRLIGHGLGLHPLLTLYGMLLSLQLFGVLGMLLTPALLALAGALWKAPQSNG